ncbi:AAA family ATPase [Thermoactinospora rubra]|uniref:AAA family ATPase n=1 Tax=Thermoactinospora rubra TaxID=1088767 RepID=UPI000A1083DE|nr:AAA family ATPase [Thermoactinospora rubra]
MTPIVLLGGASGTGKTRVSYPLARRLGVPLVEVDDIVEALQAMTTPEQAPLLHYWRVDPRARTLGPEEIVRVQIAVAEALTPAIVAVVANHLDTGTPVVVEGDYLLPAVALRPEFGGRVRAVVLHEPDEERLAANYRAREPEAGDQAGRARVSRLYGDWLAGQARSLGVPVVAARPWHDVLDRVTAALGCG